MTYCFDSSAVVKRYAPGVEALLRDTMPSI